jgi:O-antigen ligase
MSTTIAALIATLITTGMTSYVSHEMTLVGGAVLAVLVACAAVLHRSVIIHPVFLLGTIAMTLICLVSSEKNLSPFPSTIHVLSTYVAIISLAFTSRDLSGFCQQFMLGTNLLLTVFVLYQGYYAEPLKAWQISNPAGGDNAMAAQINMTLPFVIGRIHAAVGLRKTIWQVLICFNSMAVFVIMSRNGIVAMLVMYTLYLLFNHKRLAFTVTALITGVGVSFDSILQHPFVHHLLVRLRFVGYVPSAPRAIIWRVAWENIRAHPILGVGPGGSKKALSIIDTYHAHNNFIQIALETGIPSAVIFVILCLLLLRLPLQTLMMRRESFLMTLPILAYITYSWTAMPLTFPGMTLLLAACVHEARLVILRQNRNANAPRRDLQTVPVNRPRLAA